MLEKVLKKIKRNEVGKEETYKRVWKMQNRMMFK